ncbi:glycogen debranching enzyme isoform X1 [Pseudomyrmex gracilis]|uniref:glycogen debranching enzyme isoform X1 n=2 Tax=Pseudomyrmex gracilis TaxID=219809 RepID=UPI00099582E4|nr:glycogen debranching enzyme isoform X1 [Pseudomyrmex gracilis]XP_020285126.1 glycogen debranching enzyme isoform X1 [Pseudomyrmex gracilis]XP_020285127.1 glycogen debranching enzyme isoform X1 [Pseudomyrmex gracilis]XP_020285128.1 glycogen debranching enzyme isoform X1 [Pseudomyrmex gracilis]
MEMEETDHLSNLKTLVLKICRYLLQIIRRWTCFGITFTESEEMQQHVSKTYEQIRVLTLNNGEHLDGILYRLKKGWTVEFRLGASLLGRTLSVFINHPLTDDKQFDRHTYYQLQWIDESASIRLNLAGSFHYYVIDQIQRDANPIASGYLLVDPELKVGEHGENLPLDCVQIQTVLAKCLGPFSTWEKKLLVTRNSGYNAIHFTPIQELGYSKSSYSLKNQMILNPTFNDNNEAISYEDVKQFVNKMRTEWKMLSICDIVLNHTANESPFLISNPECTYNCVNSPHLCSAYILDAALFELTVQVAAGEWEFKGIPTVVETEDHLNSIRHALHTHFLPLVKIHELYTVDVNETIAEFLNLARNETPQNVNNPITEEISVIQDPQFRRLKSTIDMQLALKKYNTYRADCFDEETRLKRCAEDLKKKLHELNEVIKNDVQNHLNAAVENTIAGIRYFRVQSDGPRLKEISEKHPLVPRYFTDYGAPKSLEEREAIMYSDKGCYLMAHNGWVMNGDPLKNFAEPDSNVYIRRELIAWGDSVKLRYGKKPEDCPFLWQHMVAYVEQTAQIFDGVRLDNCHSTPIPVAEYMLDAARRIRPDLYVVAELFTNSDQKDNIFVNRLGITSLIREAMSAWDSHEEGRLVYRYGGEPVGAFLQPRKRPLLPSIAHALFLDVTHDNPSPVEKRSVFDLLPSAALVSMACCASGSNRGYDELVPHHIHVVDEKRQYTLWTDDDTVVDDVKFVSSKTGIIMAKKVLNDLHYMLGQQEFSQVFVDQIDSDIVAVTRHSPTSHESVVLVAFTAFQHPDCNASDLRRHIRPLRVEGIVEEIILEASFVHVDAKDGKPFLSATKYTKDENYINGLSEYTLNLKQHIQCCDSDIIEKVDSGDPKITQLNFVNFQPGSVIAIRVALHANIKPALTKLQDTISRITSGERSELHDVISRMDLADLNKVLYRCDQEERDETCNKFGVYDVPGYGPLVYAGLQGVISILADIRSNNDLGHPLCSNLRQGNWLIDYMWQRLKEDDGTEPLGRWLEQAVEPFHLIPRYLVPSYIDVIIVNVYMHLMEHCYNLMSDFVKNGTTFVKLLSLVSVQMSGVVRSSQLPDLSPNLNPPKPKTKVYDGESKQTCSTLSAGLPHFATGYTRNWGRDTFIALRGLLLLTGRHTEARFIILGFAGTLRHGLIPNLLDKGSNARFNCRDAVWWWLYIIKCYTEEVPDGLNILSDKVSRLFPTDDSPALPAGQLDQPLYEVMQEALTVHFQGLCFRERNAGKQIDEHMTDRGFNNQIGVHPETGFVFGGNDANCGTWMDKMGSSEKAGNKGKPATPRNGSAVEIVGLSKSVLSFLAELYKQNLFPYGSVQRKSRDGQTITWSYKQWADKIQANFEKYFYVNEVPTEGELKPNLIHRRGIFKDSHGATQEWADYQLRPNFPITMVVAPELFNPNHAWTALKKAEEILLGPLGMKTLDPADWAYNGYYDNSNDSTDIKVAHGWNYHQGPEWIWPIGYFLRARLHFASLVGGKDELRHAVESTEAIISKHFIETSTNHWRGLPELTNKDGAYCNDSCRTQAWSASSIIEVLHDLQKIKQELQSEEVKSAN